MNISPPNYRPSAVPASQPAYILVYDIRTFMLITYLKQVEYALRCDRGHMGMLGENEKSVRGVVSCFTN